MKFMTRVPVRQSDRPIDYQSSILLVGSCFSENIGQKFEHFKFAHSVNQLGILYSPTAISTFFALATGQKSFSEADLFCQNGLWHCFDTHSDMSGTDKDTVITKTKQALENACEAVKMASHVIITPGTAWVYRNKQTAEVVANCHKVPQSHFVKELRTVQEVIEDLQLCVDSIRSVNINCTIIFTVSPVRHIKDGFIENNRSKSHLIAGVHAVIAQNSGTEYFPSYEIMTDELRDYRFYAEDMLHPSQTAVDYMWSRFSEVYFSKPTLAITEEVGAIQRALRHRPFNPDTEQYQDFRNKLAQRITAVKSSLPPGAFRE